MDDQGSVVHGDTLSSESNGQSGRNGKRRQSTPCKQDVIEHAVVHEVAPRLVVNLGDNETDQLSPTETAKARNVTADALIALLLKGDWAGVRGFATLVESTELSLIEACQQIFIPVAESLGTMWRDDRMNFVEVTLALSCLQSMVQDFAARRSTSASPATPDRRIMLARAPGEDHVFGLVILGLYFDSAGWDVAGGSDVEAGESLYRELHDHDYGVLGLSVGSQANIGELGIIIKDARKSSKNPRIKIAVGGAAIRADASVCERVGADFAAQDANEAIEKAESLVA